MFEPAATKKIAALTLIQKHSTTAVKVPKQGLKGWGQLDSMFRKVINNRTET